MKDRPFALVGVHIGGSTAKQLKKVVEKEELSWRSFVDAGNASAGPIATKWNLSATPTFYVIDHKGVIRFKWAGPPGDKVIDAALEKLIKVAEENGKQPRSSVSMERSGLSAPIVNDLAGGIGSFAERSAVRSCI